MLEGLENDPNYKNIDEAIQCGYGDDKRGQVYQNIEEMQRETSRTKYTIYNYYNKAKGMYLVTVNQKVIIREGAIPFAHGDLPFSILVDNKNPRQIYGRGECELLESTKYERNEIRNQIVDMVRQANNVKLFTGSGMSMQSGGFIDNTTQVIKFDGDLSQFQYMKQPSQDSNIYNVEELLRNDATWITGIDNNSLVGAPTRTAFEARLQEQTKLKGISVSLKLADFFFTRMARQRLANIQFWLPITTGRKICGKSTFRTIPLSGKEKSPINRYVDGEVKQAGYTFKQKDDFTDFLELTPSLIQSNLDISITTPSTTSVLKELDRAELQEVFASVMEVAQLNPDILKTFDLKEYLTERIKQAGRNPDDYFNNDNNSSRNIKDIRSEVLGDLPLPFKPSAQPARIETNPVTEKPLNVPQNA
jgi:hypothetical protein